MINEPLVTILMPAYNHEEFIQEALYSLIEQEYKNVELIITNDGSTDNTHDKIMEIFDKCDDRFVNFKYINRPNKGLVQTLKDMEPMVKGKYLSLIYSDDIYIKDKIVKQVQILENNNEYALCYGKMFGIDETSKVVKKYKTKHAVSGNIFKELLNRNFITAPTVMMKTEVFNSVGGYDLKFVYDDYSLWLKIARNHKIFFMNEELVYYRMHGNNVSSDLVRTISFAEQVLLSWSNEKEFSSAIKRFYLKSFYNLARSGKQNKEKTKEYMINAMPTSWYDPRFIKAAFRYYFKNN